MSVDAVTAVFRCFRLWDIVPLRLCKELVEKKSQKLTCDNVTFCSVSQLRSAARTFVFVLFFDSCVFEGRPPLTSVHFTLRAQFAVLAKAGTKKKTISYTTHVSSGCHCCYCRACLFGAWTLVHFHAFLSFSVHVKSGEEGWETWLHKASNQHGVSKHLSNRSYVGIYQMDPKGRAKTHFLNKQVAHISITPLIPAKHL